MVQQGPPPFGRTVAAACGASAVGASPAFFLASLATFAREDFAFGPSQLGLAVTSFFVASAVAVLPGGRLCERVGARSAILAAVSGSAVASLGLAATASSIASVVPWMVLAGVANGVAQPAGNLALARGVPASRNGLAFGIKQSAIPASTLSAGAAVPLLGLTVGWRWAFVVIALAAAALAMVMPPHAYASPGRRGRPRGRGGDIALRPLVALAVATGLGSAFATSLGAFYVESAVSAGTDVGTAGVLLVVGSVSVIVVRMLLGWQSDRMGRDELGVVVGLMAVGTTGFLGLAAAGGTWWIVPATLVAFMAGWGWPGLFNQAVVQLNDDAPAMATSITQAGVFVGGVAGPALFGAIADHVSFAAAWAMAAAFCACAAGGISVARVMVRRARA